MLVIETEVMLVVVTSLLDFVLVIVRDCDGCKENSNKQCLLISKAEESKRSQSVVHCNHHHLPVVIDEQV